MFGLGIGLTLVCGLAWTVADTVRKQLTTSVELLALTVLLAGGQLMIVAALSPLILATPSLGTWGTWQMEPAYWSYAVPSFICTTIGHVLFLSAVKRSDLSLTIPYLSFSPIFVMGFGLFILGEWPTMVAGMGVGIVTIGAFFLNKSANTQQEISGLKRLVTDRGSQLMLGTAFVWSAAAAFDKGALAHGSAYTHMVLLLASTQLILWCACLFYPAKDRWRLSRRQWLRIGIACAIMLAAIAFQFGAYAVWEVAYVEAVKRAIGLVGAVVFGVIIFGEPNLAKRLPAVLVMAIGSALVIFGG